MNKLLIAFLLLVSTPAIALNQLTFIDQIHNCVEITVAYTRFAQIASVSSDNEHATFVAYIQQIADRNENPKIHDQIIQLGELAWIARGQSVQKNAMELYNMCYSKLGSKA